VQAAVFNAGGDAGGCQRLSPRHLPIDMLVLDWFYYTKMGEMDFIKDQWPDPADMNRQLHAMNIETMISVWPRFRPDSRFYDQIQRTGGSCIMRMARRRTVFPTIRKVGSIRLIPMRPGVLGRHSDNIASQGFDSFWADETEPDLPRTAAISR